MSARLPDFLIAGTMKSGTSSLANWLAGRADVHVAAAKELHFFNSDARYARGADWYAEQLAAPEAVAVAGEATPLYAFYPEAIERLAALLPAARVIVCLREPAARAHSHYLHFRDRRASERRSFARAVAEELAGEVERPGALSAEPYGPDAERYVAQGLYLPQLERLAAAVGRERLHVVLTDDLRDDPLGSFAAACRFLGLAERPTPDQVGERSNAHFEYRPRWLWRRLVRTGALQRLPDRLGRWVAVDLMRREVAPPPIDAAVRERLQGFYAPHNAALASWLGRELPWP